MHTSVSAWNKTREPLVVCDMRLLKLSYAFSLLTLLPLFPLQGQTPETPVVSAGNAAMSACPLWGNLAAGPYRVGFRRLFRFDASRTWQTTRDFKGTFSPDLSGRPVQINVWYPAATTGPPRQMHFADYVDQTAPEPFSKFNTIVKDRNRRNAADSVPRDRLAALQTTPMNAYWGAAPAEGHFPAVLYFGGLDAEINSNVILAEYLASHGYIFASISLLGPSDEQTFQSRTSVDLDASVRDMEFAWSALAENSNAKANLQSWDTASEASKLYCSAYVTQTPRRSSRSTGPMVFQVSRPSSLNPMDMRRRKCARRFSICEGRKARRETSL